MTREARLLIRQAIDARVRELVADDPPGCAGCGGDFANVTLNCGTCWDRQRRRRRRKDPELHKHDLHIWREARRNRLAREREARAAA